MSASNGALQSLRDIRLRLKLSQVRFAALLGVAAETYRTWDSGRQPPPPTMLHKAARLLPDAHHEIPTPLDQLARVLGVHPRTLRGAARDGRLAVTYATRTFCRHPIARATIAAGETFMKDAYRRPLRWSTPAAPRIEWPEVPEDFDRRLLAMRRGLQMTQTQLAHAIGAAGKAVVYQWESRKRKPSPLFWSRIDALRQVAVLSNIDDG